MTILHLAAGVLAVATARTAGECLLAIRKAKWGTAIFLASAALGSALMTEAVWRAA